MPRRPAPVTQSRQPPPRSSTRIFNGNFPPLLRSPVSFIRTKLFTASSRSFPPLRSVSFLDRCSLMIHVNVGYGGRGWWYLFHPVMTFSRGSQLLDSGIHLWLQPPPYHPLGSRINRWKPSVDVTEVLVSSPVPRVIRFRWTWKRWQ